MRHSAALNRQRRTALVVILSLILGIVGATGVVPVTPAAAAVSVNQVSNWKFDAGTGTTAVDSVGGKTATLGTGATWTPGIRGASSLALNGSGTGNAVTSPVLNTTSSFSVSAYVKLNNVGGYQTVVSQDGDSFSSFFLQLRADTGRFGFTRLSADSTSSVANAQSAPVVGQWYHLVGVYNSVANTLALYVNGRLQQTVAAPTTPASTGSFVMGRGKFGGNPVDFVNGTIDDVRAYSGAVTADDVEQIADAAWYKLDEGSGTTAVDAGLNAGDGTLTNGPTYTSGPVGPSALDLDGVNDFVDGNRSVIDTSKSFSVTAWARADSSAGFHTALSVDGTNVSGFYLQRTDDNRWRFIRPSGDVASPAYSQSTSTATVTAGNWYHLTGVYNSVAGTITLYVNGVSQGTAPYSTGFRAAGDLVIGRALSAGAQSNFFDGAIDEVHAYPFVIEDSMITALAAPTPPPAPATPTATSPTSTSVTVNWVAPAPIFGSPTTGYVVTPYVNGTAQAPQTFNSTATTQTFSGLTTGSSYRYTVAAINANGTGVSSAQSVAVVPAVPVTVPGTPTGVTATAGTQSARLTWTAPNNGGSAITGYRITPFIGGVAQTVQVFSGTATTQQVTGLTAGTAYTFTVAAVNSVGTGPSSAATTAVTPNAAPAINNNPPNGQTGVAYSSQLAVTGGTAPFTWSVSAGTLPAGLTLSAGGLLSGTPTADGSYTFTTRVADAGGGVATQSLTVVISGKPATPAPPTATAGLTSATVRWVAPSSSGSTITSYVITPYLGGVAQTAITVDPSAKIRVLNGLTAGGSYTFTIAAVNANGTSTASGQSNAVTPYSALTAPTITSVTASTGSTTLSWTAPSSNGGSAITGYTVTPYVGGAAQTPQVFNSTATTQTVTGLSPGTTYTFKVAANNASGTDVLYRINGGGPAAAAIDGGPAWSADNATDSTLRNSGSRSTTFGPINAFDSSVPSTTPSSIFESERWDPIDGTDLQWAIPVTAGANVKVRLYFAEGFFSGPNPGQRKFDVTLEGSAVLPAFDVFAAAGGSKIGTMREFAATSDGTINIDFGRNFDNPIINGIEIIQTGTATTGPQSAASASATPNASPSLTFAAPPAGEVNVAYSRQLTVNDGTSPFAWSVSAGTLPAGLTLNASTGLLSGTPTAAGSYTFTVRVVDASGQAATRAVTLVVAAAPSITFAPAAGEVGVPYSQQPTVSGGSAPYVWSLAGGSLPAGVTLNTSTGLVSGTPTASGTFSITLRVAGSSGQTASRVASIVIAAQPTLTSTPPNGRAGVGYSYTFVATGGTGPFTYSVTAGSLPSNMTLSSAGVLSGTSQIMGTYNFTVKVADSFNQSATKVVTLTLDEPPIRVVKTANLSSVAPGGTVTFTVTATNVSNNYYGNTHLYDPLSDVLDDATLSGTATVSSGGVVYSGGTLDWSIPLDGGASATMTYTVVVANPTTGNKVLSGLMTSSFASTGCNPGTQASTCNAIVTVSGLNIVKTPSVTTTTPGSVVTFSTVVTNNGQTAFPAATFTDDLGGSGVLDDATYNGNAAATSGGVGYSNGVVSWTGALAVGASATISYSVTVRNPDPGNLSLSSTIVSPSAGSTCPSGNPAPSCTALVTVQVPGLSITNTPSTTTTTPGATIGSTITMSNTGQTAYVGITVNIEAAGAIDDVSPGPVTATTGVITYSGTNVMWTGDVALGGSVTITTSGTVLNPPTGDRSITTVVSSSAPGNTCPVGSPTTACTSTIQVLVPELTITKAADVATTTPGSVVTYTVVVTNTGQTAYTGATFSDTLTGVLDDATYNGNAAATAGAVSYSAPTLTWTGDLAIAATAKITYSVTVRSPDPGDKALTATVTSTTPFSNCGAGSADSRCTSNVTVLIPGLTIVTGADVATATPGSVVRYTTTVTNTGQTTYTGLGISLNGSRQIDDGTPNGDGAVTRGSIGPGPAGALWTLNLAPGETATITGTYTVKSPPTGDRLMVSRVSSDAPGSNCPSSSTDPACGSTVTVLVPALTITKTANASTVVTGGTTSYTITVANTGETAYPAASFTDSLATVLSDAVYEDDAAASTGTVSYASETVSWTGALAIGASATITYSVVVKDPDPGDKRMINTVVSTSAGANCASSSTDPRCTTTVDVLVPGLTIVKSASVASTAPGAVVGFTVKVTNSGSTVQNGASFTDSLSGVLDDATYTGAASATSGTVSYAAPTLSWNGDLAVGATATITYSATVKTAPGGNNLLTNTVVSPTRGVNCPTAGTDPRCTVTVPVARLLLVRTPLEATTTPGSVVHLPVTFTNTGQVPYVGISVTIPRADTSDDVIATGDDVPSSGTLVRGTTTTVWTGDIPVGGVVTIAFTRTVKDPATGNRLIAATLQSSAPGNNCPPGGTDPQCSMAIPVLIPGLTITKTASATQVAPGDPVTYTVTVHNSGQTPYSAASLSDPLAGVLDDATYAGGETASSGTVSYASSTSTLSWTGSLAVGATATISYSVQAKTSGAGDKSLLNVVTSTETGNNCRPGSDAAACRSSVLLLTPALTITKSANQLEATLGSTVTYSVLVTNSGQTSYPAAAFTDSLAGVLDDASYNVGSEAATSGTSSYSEGVLSWSGALAPGASATITYVVTVNATATGDRTMVNTVVSGDTGNNCAAGSTDRHCTVVVGVVDATALTLNKVASVPSTRPGAEVEYTITVTNATNAPINDVSFSDPLTQVLDDAAYNADAQASSGTVGYAGSTLSWTGNVPAYATVTVTYSVTVATVGTGDERLVNKVSSASVPGGNNCPADSTDQRCTSTVPVARLALAQSADSPTTTPGSLVTATGTFTNTGQVDYVGVTVSLDTSNVTDDVLVEGDSVSSGIQSRTATGLTWTGDIPVGATVTTTRLLRVKNPDPGNKLITGTYLSDAPGNNCAAGTVDPACTFSVTVLTPALTITKTANATSVIPNGVIAYTITINNNGQTPYTAATVTDSLAGVVDDATYNGNATASTGTVTYVGSTLTWLGDLPVGSTSTITFTVTAHRPADGDKQMLNRISSTEVGSTCPPASGNPACVSTVDVRTPALTTVVTASKATALPGDVVTYTVTTTNTGQTDYVSATFDAPLAGLLDDATYAGGASATSGSVVRTGDTLTWTGPLVQGAAATVTYSVTVTDPVLGDHSLEQKLTSIRNGSNCLAASTDPRCSTSVPIASLEITNQADVTTTKPTGVINYTVVFTNTGQVPYVGSTLSYNLIGAVDDAVYNADAAATSGSLTVYVGQGRVSWTGDIPVNGAVTITGSVTVKNPNPGDKIVTTKVIATDAPGSNCAAGSTDPGCVSNVTVLTPALTLSKVVDKTTVTPGGTVTYTITATNTGQTPYTGATVRDNMIGAASDTSYHGGATATSGGFGFADDILTWTGDLAVGASVTITYSLQVDDPDLGDRSIVNRVESDELGSTCPTGTRIADCTTTVSVRVPALSLTLSPSSTTTTPGSAVTYTWVIGNTGQTAYVGAAATVSLAQVLDDATYGGGAQANLGGVAYVDQTLTWTGDLAVGATATVTYVVTVASPDVGDRSLTTSYSSAAAGSTCTEATPCRNAVTVLTPGLAISNTASVSTAAPGDPVTFSILIRNTGETPYTNTTVNTALSDVLDDANFSGVVNASSGVASYANATVSWTGSLAVGASATVTYVVTVKASGFGTKLLSSSAVSAAPGSTCLGDTGSPSCTAAVTVLVPALTITKSADRSTTTPGGVVGYTITIHNSGETAYAGATVTDSLADLLADASFDGNAVVAGGGTLSYADSTLRWVGSLNVGATATITYSATVDDPDVGDHQLVNTVSSSARGSTCPVGSTAPDCTSVVTVLTPGLSLTKTADKSEVVAGDAVTYTITVTNTGETAYQPATFTDSLTGVLDDASYAGAFTASSGSVTYTNSTLAWSGPLGLGEVATVSYTVTTTFPGTGDHNLTNSVVSSSAGSTCGSGAEAGCEVAVSVLVPALTITKSASASTVIAGNVVDYTITAENTGESTYANAVLTDPLAGVLDDAVWGDDLFATSGTPSYAGGTLGWTGSLAPGQTVVITYSVTVNDTVADGAVLTNRAYSDAVGSTCSSGSVGAPCATSTTIENSTITLEDLSPSFTLTGLPGTTVTLESAVDMTVDSTGPGGYSVTVQGTADTLTGQPGNVDSIPIGQLRVRESETTLYAPVSETVARVVHSQDRASAPGGDAVSNDFQVQIPFVASDTYSTTLEYIATAQ